MLTRLLPCSVSRYIQQTAPIQTTRRASMNLVTVGIALPWLFVGMGCWLGLQLVRQNGRILLRLEAIENQLGELVAAGEQEADTDELNGHRPLKGRRTLADS